MASEPFNIFSHRVDVRGVIAVLRRVANEIHVEGPEDDWTRVTARGPKKMLRKRERLVISHDSQFYDRPEWSNYVLGLANYLASFADAPRKDDILRGIRNFRFILAFPEADFGIEDADVRVGWVYEICRHLDGVIFTPSTLRDAQGRILIAINGDCDATATLPAEPPRQDHPDADAFDSPRDENPVAEHPSAQRVAQRALILAAIGERGLIEHERDSLESADEMRQELQTWIQAVVPADEIEPDESKALQRPVGTLERQAMVDTIWRLEGLGVLLWALGLYELPPYDQLVKPKDLFAAAGIFDREASSAVISVAKLRPVEQLTAYRRHATMAHWRLRNFVLHPGPLDFVEFSQGCWIGTFDISEFRILDNDMMVGERAIADADPSAIDICQSAARERHLAINWLLEGAARYSDTDRST